MSKLNLFALAAAEIKPETSAGPNPANVQLKIDEDAI